MDEYIAVEDARARILESLTPLGSQRLLTVESVGRRLAEPIVAPWDSPAFDNSAMDGFAFHWEDRDRELDVVGESAAGEPFDGVVSAGQAVRIMTGAMVPEGADTVAMREICEFTERTVSLTQEPGRGRGANIRRRGEYMEAGSEVLQIGDVVGPAEVGLLASFGRTVVYVHRTPRVGVVTTGTELVEPDREPADSQIVNSNAYMLEALVREAGGEPVVLPIVPDDEDATRAAIRDVATTTDLVVTIGGVSVGDYDFVRRVLREETGGMSFWKVKMKPGKPLAFGRSSERGTPIVGLPGNPVSSFVGFHQFVRPVLAVLQGTPIEEASLRRSRLTTAGEIHSTPRRRHYVSGRIGARNGEAVFVPHPSQSSGNVLTTCRTDAFAVIEEGVDFVEAGTLVDVDEL